MKIINNIANTKSERMIKTCTKDEAFRLGSNWYTKIEMSDFNIRCYNKDFVENHALIGHEKGGTMVMIPCVHLSSMSFVYINGLDQADEWATLSATLTTL